MTRDEEQAIAIAADLAVSCEVIQNWFHYPEERVEEFDVLRMWTSLDHRVEELRLALMRQARDRGFSSQQIAKQLGITRQAVEKAESRARIH